MTYYVLDKRGNVAELAEDELHEMYPITKEQENYSDKVSVMYLEYSKHMTRQEATVTLLKRLIRTVPFEAVRKVVWNEEFFGDESLYYLEKSSSGDSLYLYGAKSGIVKCIMFMNLFKNEWDVSTMGFIQDDINQMNALSERSRKFSVFTE